MPAEESRRKCLGLPPLFMEDSLEPSELAWIKSLGSLDCFVLLRFEDLFYESSLMASIDAAGDCVFDLSRPRESPPNLTFLGT